MEKIFRAFIGPTGFGTARVFEGEVESEVYGGFLCDAFESDFQSVESCEQHIKSILDMFEHEQPSTQWSGNAYEITINPISTIFSNELTYDCGRKVPTYEYLSALCFWMQFLTTPSLPVENCLSCTNEDALCLALSSIRTLNSSRHPKQPSDVNASHAI